MRGQSGGGAGRNDKAGREGRGKDTGKEDGDEARRETSREENGQKGKGLIPDAAMPGPA